MNKSSSPSPTNNPQLDEDWTSHPIIDWISAHKSIALWALFGLVAALIIASRLITWQTLDAEKDFFQAQATFTQFQEITSAANSKGNSEASTDLEQLQAIMKRHPELGPKYEGALAQTLLITGEIPLAKTFIEDVFKRTQPDQLQLYQNYTQTSLMIAQENYAEALKGAKQLKSDLDQLGEEASPVLYVFNLVRLAMLHLQAEQPQEELKVWEELQNQPQRTKALLAVKQAYQIGNASLDQYIEERKNALTN